MKIFNFKIAIKTGLSTNRIITEISTSNTKICVLIYTPQNLTA